jgi:hypothetical protein
MLDILLSLISASYTIQTIYNLFEKTRMSQDQYVEDLVKESVEQAYVAYIYDIKQKCKLENVEFTYDKSKAYQIACDYFFNSYSKPLFRRTNRVKINKLIRDELRFYRAKKENATFDSLLSPHSIV